MVTQVEAVDSDIDSSVTYSIVAGNTDNSFYINEKSGTIRVSKKLDYESITAYNLTVKASDDLYNDTAQVEIFIENVNDNPPVFEKFDKNLTFEIGTNINYNCCLTNVVAYDPDIKNREAYQHIKYSILNDKNQPYLSIDKFGCVSHKISTREKIYPQGSNLKYMVFIMAEDEDGSSTSQHSYGIVHITFSEKSGDTKTLCKENGPVTE